MCINKKMFFIMLICVAVTFSGCGKLDVIGNGSVNSFNEILSLSEIADDELNYRWLLTAPDKSTGFIWSKDFSKSERYDIAIQFDAKPFIDSGLDTDKLPEGILSDDIITLGEKIGTTSPDYTGDITPLSSFEQILMQRPDLIGYHGVGDHYMLNIGNGNMVEFAKDINVNIKDIIFILNPQPFIDAGADPENIDGWVFTEIETMDESGETIKADKLLKIFDLS